MKPFSLKTSALNQNCKQVAPIPILGCRRKGVVPRHILDCRRTQCFALTPADLQAIQGIVSSTENRLESSLNVSMDSLQRGQDSLLKGQVDMLTIIDRLNEDSIRSGILGAFPDTGIDV